MNRLVNFAEELRGIFPMSKVMSKGPEAHTVRYLTNNSKGILGNGIKWNLPSS